MINHDQGGPWTPERQRAFTNSGLTFHEFLAQERRDRLAGIIFGALIVGLTVGGIIWEYFNVVDAPASCMESTIPSCGSTLK